MSSSAQGCRKRRLSGAARSAEEYRFALDLHRRSVKRHVAACDEAEQRGDAPKSFLPPQGIDSSRHEDLGSSGVDRVPTAVFDPEVKALVIPIQARVERVRRRSPLAERPPDARRIVGCLCDLERLTPSDSEELEWNRRAWLKAEAHALDVH